ncbi:hypothetical protein ABTE27_23415, partial [Acinetobacter baumannii]
LTLMLRTLIFILIIFPFCSCHSQQDKTATNNLSKPNKDFQFRALSENEKLSYNNAIQPLYNKMLLQKGFNGAVLLVKNGE